MPFRAPEDRASEDVEYLRGHAPDAKGPDGKPLEDYGLAEGEWIAYWAVFPHSLTGKVTSDATVAMIDPFTGQMTARFDPGIATIAKVAYGIVDWNLLGKDGRPVPWDAKRARELLDGLPRETFQRLAQIVSVGAPAPDLNAPVDDLPNAETVGNASGES